MNARIKIFTFVSGHGETPIEPPYEDHINQWLSELNGRVLHVGQSESERTGSGQHVTICIWYLPNEAHRLEKR